MSINILILGGSGRFGRHVTQSLRDLGHCPHLFDRSCDDLAQWANWADVVVNGCSPQYPDWFRDIMPMTRHLIAAIQDTPKRVILAGNVYNFGPDAPPPGVRRHRIWRATRWGVCGLKWNVLFGMRGLRRSS